MSEEIPPQPVEFLPDANAFEKFGLRGARQIRTLLQELIARRTPLTVFPDPAHSFSSVLVQLTDNDDALLIDSATDPESNERALQSSELRCVAELDGIRIQFNLNGVDAEEHDGHTLFNAWIPETILRFQRREYFRLETPLDSRPQCTLLIINPDGTERTLNASVLDIGAGGMAVTLVEGDAADLEVGKLLVDCMLHLPGTEPLKLNLEVRSLNKQRYPSGVNRHRAGLRYVDLSTDTAARVERYILKAQSELPRHMRGR